MIRFPKHLPGILIASVWIFHGLYSKLLDGIPRHGLIVARILGDSLAEIATPLIGIGEILMGCWVLSGRYRRSAAALQTLALIPMNTIEIILAPDLLLSPVGMVALNLCFIAFIWWWALRKKSPDQSRL